MASHGSEEFQGKAESCLLLESMMHCEPSENSARESGCVIAGSMGQKKVACQYVG